MYEPKSKNLAPQNVQKKSLLAALSNDYQKEVHCPEIQQPTQKSMTISDKRSKAQCCCPFLELAWEK